MIIDSHVHVFPFLGQAAGFCRPSDRFAWMQREIGGHHQPVRRASDNAIAPGHSIWSPIDSSPSGRVDVDFRVGRFGRMEWTVDGVDYYKQYLPPSLEQTTCDADCIIAEMDYAGVDVAVLQNDLIYGRLNAFFGEAARRYPGRFLLTAQVDEKSLDTQEAVTGLNNAVKQHGHRGVFVNKAGFWLDGYRRLADDPSFEPFWAEVEHLRLVVYWSSGASPRPGIDGHLDSMRHMLSVLDRHPGISTVMVNGLPSEMLFGQQGPLPDVVRALIDGGRTCLEVLFPIRRGGMEEYPYLESLGAVRYL